MLSREGDFIQHKSNVIFDVKGLNHPKDKIVAFPRYIPNQKGSRSNENLSYDKVYSLSDRYKFLREHLPHLIIYDKVFGETMCEVPVDEIIQHFHPQKKLESLMAGQPQNAFEEKALQFAADLQEAAGISCNAIGVSGSILAGLTIKTSDIDLLIYGEKNSRKAYSVLQHMLKEDHPRIKSYTKKELVALYNFRSKDTHMSFEDFQRVEKRKAFQGMYQGTDYFIRFVKDWDEHHEHYGDECYNNVGYAKITAKISNNTEALFTPCNYQLENVKIIKGPKLTPIKVVSSFRGRFCEQAENGETITAQGKIEHVSNKKNGESYYRLILGSNPEDYMVLEQSNAELSTLGHNTEDNKLR
ncbi:MAG: nucleotidyltransferase domain-containing protein [Nitrososphaerota archaeon]|jgi:predicted nucleotidyltransferase|nr:nucleotidyltransferase domain-containing protein [Nitrososphaerota archaeon]